MGGGLSVPFTSPRRDEDSQREIDESAKEYAKHQTKKLLGIRREQESSSKSSPTSALNRSLVIEIVRAEGFKEAQNYVLLRLTLCRYIEDSDEYCILAQVHTPDRYNTLKPVWHSYRPVCPDCRDDDVVVMELLTRKKKSLAILNTIAFVSCTVEELNSKSTFRMKPYKNSDDKIYEPETINDSENSISVEIRRIPCKAKTITKRLFLIRHGESVWNRAQAQGNVVALLRQRDHPLNSIGVEQAQSFRRKWQMLQDEDELNCDIYSKNKVRTDFESCFLSADRVYSSPLSRALQSALVCLQSHPTMRKDGIKLLSSTREIQNIGGLDSMGMVFGEATLARAQQQLKSSIGNECDSIIKDCIRVDPYDAKSEWWMYTKESQQEVYKRLDECMNTIHYGEGSSSILVGHSLFFKNIFRRYPLALKREALSAADTLQKTNLYENLRNYKLSNCACVAVELCFEICWPNQMRKKITLDKMISSSSILSNSSENPTKLDEGDRLTTDKTGSFSKDEFCGDAKKESICITDVEMMFGTTLQINDDDNSMNRDSLRESR